MVSGLAARDIPRERASGNDSRNYSLARVAWCLRIRTSSSSAPVACVPVTMRECGLPKEFEETLDRRGRRSRSGREPDARFDGRGWIAEIGGDCGYCKGQIKATPSLQSRAWSSARWTAGDGDREWPGSVRKAVSSTGGRRPPIGQRRDRGLYYPNIGAPRQNDLAPPGRQR